MENFYEQQNTEKPNYKRWDNEADKPFYAGYLNTAKQNVFLVFREISEKLGLEFDYTNDDQLTKDGPTEIWRMLKQDSRPEVSHKLITHLNKQFPFFQQIAVLQARKNRKSNEALPQDYYEALKAWIGQLFTYRNYYTHAYHEPVEFDYAIIEGMRLLFDDGRRRVKEVKELNPDDVAHLVRLDKNGERKGFKYGFTEKEGNVNEKGFLFFVSLWLEKKDSQRFLKKHKGFKKSEKPSEKATLDVFSWYNVRVPKPRLESDDSQQALFLNMVNELGRCPVKPYNQLSPEDRQKFVSDNSEEEESVTPNIRKNNRFHALALAYLDSVFEHICFHVDLGNYCFHSYPQEIEGEERERRWIKRLKSFGKLRDFNLSNLPKAWKKKTEGEAETYITETTPHYHIEANNIGLKWFDNYDPKTIWPNLPSEGEEKVKPRTASPDYWLSIYELPAMGFYQIIHQHLHSKGIKNDNAEKVIAIYHKKVNAFLDRVKNGKIAENAFDSKTALAEELEKKDLFLDAIPKQVVDYLVQGRGSKSHQKIAMDRLKGFQEENDEMLEKAKRQAIHFQKHPGSKDYVAMRPGDMADFLARDMINLQKPVKGDKGKPNSTEFQILQAKLAYFGKEKNKLNDIFKTFNLIESNNPHPFLQQINIEQSKGILDFFITYLEHRQSFFKQCMQEQKFQEYHFLKLPSGEQDIQSIIERHQNAITNLPRGLFKRPIIDALKKSEKTRVLAEELENKERANVAYIIKRYFEAIRNDSHQEFYDFKKHYDLLDQLYDDRKKRDKTPRKNWYFTTAELAERQREIQKMLEEKIQREIKSNNEPEKQVREKFKKRYKAFTQKEKEIRFQQTCDQVLFLMAEPLFHSVLADSKSESPQPSFEDYKLKGISPTSEKSLLSQLTEAKLPVYYPEKEKTHSKVIVRPQMKIKNYGDFRAYLKDRRIYGLLPFVDDDPIQFEALQKELEFYETCRHEVFNAIIAFEQKVIDKHGLTTDEFGYIPHEKILENAWDLKEGDKKEMEQLRNAFCHSQYPRYEAFQNKIDGNGFNQLQNYGTANNEIEGRSIAVQLKNWALSLYNQPI